ncbi:uncharacterized protein PpBr36_05725 [Pyricularia pennisetigena]|uniref:uncharacterized protein n=1 Tax=Pyricularia pennisetigena TaxID=1578925 RepID=UPI00114F37AF|nr:uncharacterized protein PpBr36_05725 [Pyricularia pennisetigena]TLS23526.1 hypothetical protein PpBr36_05725 [Pyricularia pennisetigena]
MSRRATARGPPGGASAVSVSAPPPPPGDDANQMCPVCKALRYLNKDMVLKINPKCYHLMCENCVVRLFQHGQQQCPHPGCTQKLRFQEFRAAFFGDLTVEREVDVRKRVFKVFNQQQDDFQTLQDYNNYLDQVECLVFDLLSPDRARAEKAAEDLQKYEAEHRAQIERARRKGAAAEERERRMRAAELEAAERRRKEARERDREEERLRLQAREADLDSLARAPDGTAERLVSERLNRHKVDELAASEARDLGVGGLSIRGLKEKRRAPEGPYDPFGGLDLAPARYKVHEEYKNEWLDGARRQPYHTTGGYCIQEYYTRSMFEAFGGLAVFIGDEKETGLVGEAASAGAVATVGASMAAGGDRMDVS